MFIPLPAFRGFPGEEITKKLSSPQNLNKFPHNLSVSDSNSKEDMRRCKQTPVITLLTSIPVFHPCKNPTDVFLNQRPRKYFETSHHGYYAPPNTSALGTLLWGILDELFAFLSAKA
ncbi:hypothetical protein CEXT_11921 [Caerostris extrusa]|uniref:Uncharacterized protein n=1 Tax=Caerostris extrusa TaxID=172846 RepID=A0AAV4UUK2_CAEEX|nr:hypothetical protein CEXT_11921 [Caerostris extrusa]